MAQPQQSPPSPLRLPPHDVDAEKSVLSACMTTPEKIESVASVVRPPDFYHAPHQRIFGALLEMRADNVEIDIVLLAARLRDREQLAGVGGPAYLGQLMYETPADSHYIDHAKVVAELARRRRVIAEMQRLAAEGYGKVEGNWEISAARAIADAAEIDTRSSGVIAEAWKRMPADLLDFDPEPRRWLLRHPTYDGAPCPPGRGDGFIPMEKAGILVASGGAGKTYAMIQLAVCLVLGLPWFGHFQVTPEASKGQVCLALAEESMKDFHERLKKIADAMKLTKEQRAIVLRRIMPLPLFSKPVELLASSPDGVSLVETEVFYGLRAHLRNYSVLHDPECRTLGHRGHNPPPCHPNCAHGWSLVVIDPLARWAGDVEGDNRAATRFVQIVESLTLVPGHPTVLVVHHSSKTARRTGTVDSRGVTAITDGFRWQGTLKSGRGKNEMVFGELKNNYAGGMGDITLKRSHGGYLRVPTPEEDAEQASRAEDKDNARAAAKTAAEEGRIEAAARELVSGLRRSRVAIKTRPEMLALAKGSQQTKSAALTRLLASGRVIKDDDGYRVVEQPEGRLETSAKTPPNQDQEAAQLALI